MRRMFVMGLVTLCAAGVAAKQLTRDKVPVAETWDLTHIYANDDAWRAAKAAVEKRVPGLKAHEKKAGRSPAALQQALDDIYGTQKEIWRLYSYAHMRSDQDTREAKTLALKQEMDKVNTDYEAAIAWLKPAVLKLGKKKVNGFIKRNKKLKSYAPALDDILRLAPHTLSPGEEKILADSGLIAESAENIYSILSYADIKFPTIKLPSGEKVELTQAAYTKHRAAPSRKDRVAVFKSFWQVYKGYSRTLGVALDANVKRDLFYARARKYDNSLASSLGRNNIPVAVYHNLVKDIRSNLPTLHRYLRLRARMLGIKELAYHDLYPPLVKKVELKYSYPQAKALVAEALEPLGDDYVGTMKQGLESRWIDVHPTPGKRSGAYSSGSAYDVHPYILLNYNGGYDDVSTLAHELGHTMHSWYSNKTQPFASSDYSIFLAEVASTTNEALLIKHMLKNNKDPEVRLFLLGSYLESMRQTIFRQAMFAEFELAIHEAAERGEALNNEKLSKLYGDLLKAYHGHDEGVCQIDDLYTYEWAYIPHFYYNFYVYQYATGMVAATALAQRVLNGGEQELNDYLGFLKAGSSRYPIDILKSAGVDLTTSAPFNATVKVMNEVMDEIEQILKTKAKRR